MGKLPVLLGDRYRRNTANRACLIKQRRHCADFEVSTMLQAGSWHETISGMTNCHRYIDHPVKPHGVQVWVLNESVSQPELLQAALHAVQYK